MPYHFLMTYFLYLTIFYLGLINCTLGKAPRCCMYAKVIRAIEYEFSRLDFSGNIDLFQYLSIKQSY